MMRDWMGRQSGRRARALAAQDNSFEGLPFFIGAVVIAHQLGIAQGRLDMVYIALYIRGFGTARSTVWALAFAVNIVILFAGR